MTEVAVQPLRSKLAHDQPATAGALSAGATCTTTLPRWWPLPARACAAGRCSQGQIESMTGTTSPRAARSIRRCRASVVLRPLPLMLRRPWRGRASIAARSAAMARKRPPGPQQAQATGTGTRRAGVGQHVEMPVAQGPGRMQPSVQCLGRPQVTRQHEMGRAGQRRDHEPPRAGLLQQRTADRAGGPDDQQAPAGLHRGAVEKRLRGQATEDQRRRVDRRAPNPAPAAAAAASRRPTGPATRSRVAGDGGVTA